MPKEQLPLQPKPKKRKSNKTRKCGFLNMQSIQLFQVNFQRIEELIDFHRTRFPVGRPVAGGPEADLLRATLVFGVASFDAYLHRRIIEVVKMMLLRKKISKQSINKILSALKMSDSERAGYLINSIVRGDASKEILRLFEDSLDFKTFQNPQQIEDGFDMMEVKDVWRKLTRHSRPSTGPRRRGRAPQVKTFLKELTDRRNEIVHKNDMYFGDRYHGRIRPIGRNYVDTSLKRLRRIVYAIEKISEPI